MNNTILTQGNEAIQEYTKMMNTKVTLKISRISYSNLSSEDKSALYTLLDVSSINFEEIEDYYCLDLVRTESNIVSIYLAIKLLYSLFPEEPDSAFVAGADYKIADPILAKVLCLPFENMNIQEIKAQYNLSKIVRTQKIKSFNQIHKLATIPYSGILYYDYFDWFFGLNGKFQEELPESISCSGIDVGKDDIYIVNRVVKPQFKLSRCKKVCFENCVIEGNIEIINCDSVVFWNCICTGKILCAGIKRIEITEANCNYLLVYNSSPIIIDIHLCKIRRLELHSCNISEISFYLNKIYEPYLPNLSLPSCKIDMSQFIKRNISKKKISKNTDSHISEKNFYFSFQIESPIEVPSSNQLAVETIDNLLKHGDFKYDYVFMGDLKYKKMLYSNNGLKKLFVLLTGGFYKPWIWIWYLLCSTVLFSFLYSLPNVSFIQTTTNAIYNLDLLNAAHYSILQIIGANSTGYSPIGLAIVFSAIQSLLNTAFIGSFFTTVVKKYMDSEQY